MFCIHSSIFPNIRLLLKAESAKLRFLRALVPHVTRALRALVPCTFMCLMCLVLYVPSSLKCCGPCVLSCLMCLVGHASCVLRAFVPYVSLVPCVFCPSFVNITYSTLVLSNFQLIRFFGQFTTVYDSIYDSLSKDSM